MVNTAYNTVQLNVLAIRDAILVLIIGKMR
jgi:hypothetical protein